MNGGYFEIDELEILRKLGLVDLTPWLILKAEDSEYFSKRITSMYGYKRRAFARRIDNDDIACLRESDKGILIDVIHYQASKGYEKRVEYTDFWNFFRMVTECLIDHHGGHADYSKIY